MEMVPRKGQRVYQFRHLGMGPLVKDRSRGCQIRQTPPFAQARFGAKRAPSLAPDSEKARPALHPAAFEVIVILKQAVHPGFDGVSAGG
jgi:hypothetical protein